MVLHWRRCGRVGGRQNKKRKKTGFGMKLQISRFERISPRNLKYQPTNVWKDHTKSLGIDTGKDEQQLITANPISREVLLEIAGVHQWLEIKRDFSFWWLMKEAVSCTLKIAYKEKYLMKIRELNWFNKTSEVMLTTLLKNKLLPTHVTLYMCRWETNPCFLSVGYANKSVWWMPWH